MDDWERVDFFLAMIFWAASPDLGCEWCMEAFDVARTFAGAMLTERVPRKRVIVNGNWKPPAFTLYG